MTEITIKRSVQVEETVKVEFPLYFASSYQSDSGPDSSESQYRVAEDGATVEVTEFFEWGKSDKFEIEISNSSHADIGSMLRSDYYFVPSTAEAFEAALTSARDALAKALAAGG